MFPRKRLTANFVLFALLFYFPSQVLCGIETIRSKYGLSGLLPRNETIFGEFTKSDGQTPDHHKPDKETVDSLMEDDLDYIYYDEPVGRSLFPVDRGEEEILLPDELAEPRSLLPVATNGEKVVVAKKRPLALGRSLFGPRVVQVETEKPIISPLSVGKCFVEVLTSSLVKPKRKVPPGNGTNPSLSVIETCCKGYEAYVHNRSLCVPICEKPCVNGYCAKPNVCECFPDHVRSLNDDCLPTCPIGCLNGHCHMNGTCFCNKGFVLDLTNSFCMPYCSQPCRQFANCTAPETCSCINGYRFNAISGRCEPFCQYPCGNGDCTAPNVCSCYSGYRFINQTCQANCSRGCENGKCVANEVCGCDPGWVLDPTGSKCLPYCPSGCPNGKCLEPSKCTCNTGYHKVNGECKPHCPRGCLHGKCTAPNYCTCNYGYEKSFFGTQCKKIKRIVVYEHESDSRPIFNPVVVAVPAQPPPIYQPPIHVGPPPYPQQTYFPPPPPQPAQPPPIYNPPIVAQPGQVKPIYNPPVMANPSGQTKPIFNAPVMVNPSAPNLPIGGQGNIYEKQPAYNPFYQPSNPVGSSDNKPTYLEKQPAFNPNFNIGISDSLKNAVTQKPTMRTTTHKTSKKSFHKTTQKSIFSFDFWGSNSKNKAKTTQRPSHKTTRRPSPKIVSKVTSKPLFSFDIWNSNSKNTTKLSCSKSCLNGKCTGKNQCTCNWGYKMAPGSSHKCVPYCSGGCSHGTCTSPGFCTCNFGYRKKNNKCVKN